MRLLFDEHLSPKLVRQLEDLYAGSAQVQTLGLRGAGDRVLWRVALENGWTIVTRDSDFEHLSMSLGAPPKVILLSTKDGHTSIIEALLRRHAAAISRFSADPKAALLILE
jgi:predicted nuclease of predicted toxin-antitoxin system